MVSELDDVQQYLKSLPIFEGLSELGVSRLLSTLSIHYFKAGQTIPSVDDFWLVVLRNGSVEVQASDGKFLNRYASDDYFGSFQLVAEPGAMLALEDSLVYAINRQTADQLTALSEVVQRELCSDQLVLGAPNRRYSGYVSDTNTVADIMSSNVVTVSAKTSIGETARIMSQYRVSSALVTRGEKLVGIVTDRDFRSRVLAKELSPLNSVTEVMTENPKYVNSATTIYDAQHCMMAKRVHHLPVVDNDAIQGVVTLNDFIRAQNSEPLFLVRSIHRADTVLAISEAATMLPELVAKLINNNARPDHIGRTITTVTDAVIRRALELAVDLFGEPPCDYAWLAFGSQGRFDQMLGSDQDNALILSNSATDDDRRYFANVASFVNDALADAGIKYCPGEIMARNPKWCLTLREWQRTFLKWIEQPDPKALMHASIFFDMRHVVGNAALSTTLSETILSAAKENTIFLAMLSENAQQQQPPLGFFKSFVLESNGDHTDMLDLKHRGTVPIVSLARVLALANGVDAVNSIDRLNALLELRAISQREALNLIDAHEFIAKIRLQTQGKQLRAGEPVSNYINPKSLSPFVRHQLKDAFKAVREAQKLVLHRFNHGYF